ncbi:hypothetical protein WH50_21205 [Pokkaliibacter plantistimulans]|uniref:HTH lysR-type domain-containing protein n=1 Tax=Pokkaliibacter plantistimulans TaxID=1635171 RepID=A0ABX5LVC3_9GAMM|nr:LysR family transcriptional regulator [Pokkaliibacter plantistimulans]PXF29403.1 hypothetical protein WH50_21205 [Pokkaliibacter plantistimulans]
MLATTEQLLRNLDWNLIHTFVTIVDEGSITGAARRLHLAQPSISNALKRLEEHLGERLIERRKGSFALTYQGRRVYEESAAACRILQRMLSQYADEDQQIKGEIDLQVASHVHCPPLDAALSQFHRLYPQVTYDIQVVPSVEILQNVAEGRVSIGVATMQKPHPSLAYHLLSHELMGFFCGPTHPLFGRDNLSSADLRGLDYVAFESDQPKEGLHGIARLRAAREISGNLIAVSPNEEEVLRLILAGVGYGALTLDTATPLLARGQLWQLPPFSELPTIDIHLVTSTQTELGRARQLFVEVLKEETEKFVRKRYFADMPEG